MNAEELKTVLTKHKAWMGGEEGGVMAALHGTNLRRANLRNADLLCADMGFADLTGANLHCSNLIAANLSFADLTGANLYGANLHLAGLYGAKGIDGLISVSFIGSRKGTTLYDAERDSIRCGCFEGTLEQLREKNAARTDGEVWKAEYEAAIEFFEKIRAIRGGRGDGSGKEKITV